MTNKFLLFRVADVVKLVMIGGLNDTVELRLYFIYFLFRES